MSDETVAIFSRWVLCTVNAFVREGFGRSAIPR